MKRYTLQVTVLVILVLLAVFLHEYRERSTPGHKRITNSLARSAKADKIIITGNGSQVILRNTNGEWFLNSGNETREKAVEMLLQSLERLRINGPAPISRKEELLEKLSGESVRIDITEGRRSRTYFIYSAGSFEPAYIKLAGRNRIFETEVLGFNGHIPSLFVTDEGYWKSNILFSYNPSEIAEIMVIHAGRHGDSFVLKQSPRNHFSLHLFPEDFHSGEFSDSLAVRYLANFFYVPYERPANSMERLLADSLVSAVPDYLIRVTPNDGRVSEARFYKIISAETGADGSLQHDVFRLHAMINDGNDMIVVAWHSVDLLLRPSSYFYPYPR
jgi:hypothetical protein